MTTIRPIETQDWEGIDEIQRACFPPEAIEGRELMECLAELAPGYCVVGVGERMLGYCVAHAWRAEELPPLREVIREIPSGASCLYVHDLSVAPWARGTGVARRMLEQVFAQAAADGLTSASLIAVGESAVFWQHMGFAADEGLTKKYESVAWEGYGMKSTFMTRPL